MCKIILASGSPRRKEIFEQVGLDYEVVISGIEEYSDKTIPHELVQDLSKQKAMAVYNQLVNKEELIDDETYIIIAADTVVTLDNNVLGKPRDRQEAYNMIEGIQGKIHNVLTGVSIIISRHKAIIKEKCFYEDTGVEIYSMTDKEISQYIDSSEPYDKAGAYAVQGLFAKYVKRLNGDYYNVVGLPISRLYYEIKEYLD